MSRNTPMGEAFALPPLYPILDVDTAERCGCDLVAVASGWAQLGLGLQQLRAKHLSSAAFLNLAEELRVTVKAVDSGHRLLINDRIDIALAAGADGVHLGQDDLPPSAARPLLPATAVLGYSTHAVAQVEEAMPMGLSYLAIGPIFPTSSKENPDAVIGLEGLRRVRSIYSGPLVAIGGITLDNCREVWRAGADSVAVISALLAAPDPVEEARNFLLAFTEISGQR